MRKVEAPPPSRWPMMAMRQVIRQRRRHCCDLLHQRADDLVEHACIGHNAEEQDGEDEQDCRTVDALTPSLIKPAISSRVKAPVATRMAAVMVETLTNASAGTVTLRSSRTMTVITVAKPSRARSYHSWVCTSFPFSYTGDAFRFILRNHSVRYGSSIQAQTYSPKPFSLRFVKKFLNIL